jgi:hypothetical protein
MIDIYFSPKIAPFMGNEKNMAELDLTDTNITQRRKDSNCMPANLGNNTNCMPANLGNNTNCMPANVGNNTNCMQGDGGNITKCFTDHFNRTSARNYMCSLMMIDRSKHVGAF